MFNDSNLKKFTIFDISTKMQTQKDSIEFAIELSLIRILNFCKKCKIAAKNIQENNKFILRRKKGATEIDLSKYLLTDVE